MAGANESSVESPRQVLERFYAAERTFMQSAVEDSSGFDAMRATLDPAVVLHQSPDLPYGGEFRGHEGYRRWAEAMRNIFDRVDARSPAFYEKGETVVVTCELVTRIRVTGNELRLPMVQVVTVQSGKIIEFRPFYWNVPEYVAAANEGNGQ